MQIFVYYFIAWNEALKQAEPPLWRSDLILAVLKRTAGLPLIHLAGWMVALGLLQFGLWTATDLWVKSLAVPGWQAGVGRQWGNTEAEARGCN